MQTLMEQAIIPFVEGDSVVVRNAARIDLAVQPSVPMGTVQLELVCPAYDHCFPSFLWIPPLYIIFAVHVQIPTCFAETIGEKQKEALKALLLLGLTYL